MRAQTKPPFDAAIDVQTIGLAAGSGIPRLCYGGSMKHEKSAFLDELQAAFPPEAIVAAGAFEQRGGTYPDGDEYARHMDGRTWEQLDQQYFARRSDALSFLGTRHLIAVLPTYLNLLFILGPRSPVPETLLPLLTKPEATKPKLGKRFDELTDGLSAPQRTVVATALARFVAEYPAYGPPAEVALDRHWNTFLEGGCRS